MVGLTGEGARGGSWGLTATPAAAAAGWMEGGMEGWLQAQHPAGRAGGGRELGSVSSQPFRAARSITPSLTSAHEPTVTGI